MSIDEATSALDAESETLVNAALSSLLRGNNTTISIAHRLSTIKRSDVIICIGADGRIAETGPYEQLSKNPNGAFTKLMEWQMTGGEDHTPRVSHNSTGVEDDRLEFAEDEGKREHEEAETLPSEQRK